MLWFLGGQLMRIRSIRPEFWSSEDVAAMDWHTRLVYIGLWSYVDDNGVGRDVEALITAALFPLDGDLPESSRRVTGALRHLSSHGQITRYAVSGKRFLHINAWSTHQRIEKASKGRYPLPTCDNAGIQEPSRSTPGTLLEMSTIGEGEKGRRGEGEKTSRPAQPDTFESWWTTWPRKEKKVDAQRAYAKALKVIDYASLHHLTVQWFEARPTIEAKFIPLAASWLNSRRWEDEAPASVTTTPGAPTSPWDRYKTQGGDR